MNAVAFTQRYGPWAVVTGASDGIGRAFAERLAATGLNVVLVARRRALLESLAIDLGRRYGITCQVIEADLADRGAVQRIVDAVDDRDVGLAVAAAGFGTSGPLLGSTLETEISMVEVNCSAVLQFSWHMAQRMVERGRGGLVLLSSIVAFQGVPRAANYAATKAYIQSLAEGLRFELAPLGVDVVGAAPGPVRSGFEARADMRMTQAIQPDVVAAQTLRALGRRGTVRPGLLSKVLGWSLATAPRLLRVQIMARIMGGMTSHQRRPANVTKP